MGCKYTQKIYVHVLVACLCIYAAASTTLGSSIIKGKSGNDIYLMCYKTKRQKTINNTRKIKRLSNHHLPEAIHYKYNTYTVHTT